MRRLENDDDDGVGYIAASHMLRPSSVDDQQQSIALLQVPRNSRVRHESISSSVSDIDVPIYSTDNLTTRPPYQQREAGLNGRLAFAIAAAALGSSFQHGYNTGVVNAPEELIEKWIADVILYRTGVYPDQSSVTLIWSVAVSIFCIGGMIGGVITGLVADRFGRKGGLLFNNVLVLIATFLMGLAKSAGSYEMMILGRFIIGINSGLNAGLAPMYLAEISPINLRGAIGTVYQLVITISILVSQILGLGSLLGTADKWPILLAITIVPAIFQVATLPICPESPKYLLLTRGKDHEAERSLAWLRGTIEVQDEMDEMRSEYEAMKIIPKVTMRELIVNDALRIPLLISLAIMCAQQLSGINAVMFYSTKIFKMAQLSSEGAQFATLGMGAINVLMTVISLILVERAGRKTLLLIGFSGMFIDTILLTFAMVNVAAALWISYCAILFVLIFVVMFAIGPGSIPWFLVSELFTQSARPAATSLAVCVNWTANFLVGLGFLPLQNIMGPYIFIIFVVILGVIVVFVYKKVPETKNKTMEEISAMFRQQSYQ
ncbi:solute carrier family 2, facilitated glucose transporter member 1-like isoform X3 [Chrysoperla carnea]|uniref:solute carrier family 2, facilitated glucose transporter member 1-like isoform X3 n=1 Tax=Chrysoperla carnea TaxID=189513 RepID=UPI001D07EFB8|nr:solute carrier family 2, facilitated glucose transporter member 1-like isoform X3 [Chrysoperla carnea]